MYDFQKASLWKRISAALFDFIIMAMVAVGLAALLSSAFGYDNYTAQMNEKYAEYSSKYDIDLNLTVNEFNALSDEERTVYEKAEKEFSSDTEVNRIYSLLFNLTVLIIVFSVLLAFLLFEFAVPLFFKNGQTLGKKIFGIGVMMSNGVRISPVVLFVRSILGKYTIETMLPIFIVMLIYFGVMGIVGTVVILGLGLAQIILICVTKAHTPIHDKFASTVTVDFASQMIFDTEEDLLEYKKQAHLQDVQKTE